MILHAISAADLYGIPEGWNHVVVEVFDSTGQRHYCDSYQSFLPVDFPAISFSAPTSKQLLALRGTKVLLFAEAAS